MSIPPPPGGKIEFMKVEAVAAELHQTREHVLYLLRRKRIPGVKLGRKWLIPTREFRIHLQGLLKAAIEPNIHRNHDETQRIG